jgi:AAA domain
VVAPTLVLVTGMPSSGKTTVAEALARQLRLPLIAKDAIKESLYDSLGADDEASSGRLGTAAFALLFALARVTLASGASLIVEGNFFTDQDSEFSALPAIDWFNSTATHLSLSCWIGMRVAHGIPDTTTRRRSRSFRAGSRVASTAR